ncbi:MAG TPA: hypothetical protein VMR44_04470 [Thermoanaerobaculia bacterium]|nr:hypothetical protein [Thermoanaerobaculia bacterium]
MRPAASFAALTTAALLLGAGAVGATEVKSFQLQSQKAFLAGTLEGISIDPMGRLELADRAERVAALAEPFLFAAAPHPQGWVVGTGNGGKVLLVGRDGAVSELFAAPEGQVFAVAADAEGTVYAGASPGGKVYRLPSGLSGAGSGGPAAPWFESGETYVWDLAFAPGGELLVATGTTGKLFRVDSEGRGTLAYDSGDTHLRALAILPGGDVLIGTAGEGLILRLSPDGSARTIYDAAQPEVVALAPLPDGSFFAAVIASEASPVDLTAPGKAEKGKPAEAASDGEAAVTVEVGPAGAGSRPRGFAGKRAQLLSVSPAGVVETVWSFDDETVFDLLWTRDRLWVATGLEGKLYSFDGDHMVLEKDLDERQVVALLPGEPGPIFATTNAPAVYRLTSAKERSGTYTSPALDAGAVARFGTLRWRGQAPPDTRLGFSFRSGVSAEPDRTWSAWTAARAPAAGGEVPLEGVPKGRYVQWRATLGAGGEGAASPRIDGVELTYRQENLRPRVATLEVLDPGEILVPAGFNPTTQVFEPAHPNRDGIFTSLQASGSPAESRSKTLWKKGYRSFRWAVEDPNGDRLSYSLHFRRDRGAGNGVGEEQAWLPVVEDLEEDHYSFDATVLPDGLYRFRLTASDAGANPPGEGLSVDRLSEPVVIDHSPPLLAGVERERTNPGMRLRVVLEDAWNPLRAAEVSVDAGEWRPAPAADGLLDGRRETLEIEVPEGARLLLLRATDAAFNVQTFDLSGELQR